MMKQNYLKSLFLMLMMCVGMGAWAEEVTFSCEDYQGQGTTSTGSAYTMDDKSYVSIGESKFFGNTSYAQFYAGGTITVTPKSGATITKIAITTTSTSYNGYQSSGKYTASKGSVAKNTSDNAIVEWTGTATSAFTIDHDKQIRWTSIVVTYKSSESGESQDPILYTVTLGDDNSNIKEQNEGEGVTLPSRNDVGNYKFIGWATTNLASETTQKPTLIESGIYKPSKDVTLYPIYQKAQNSSSTNYNALTSIADYATANNWQGSGAVAYKSITMDDNITVSTTGTTNNGKYYNDWRLYQGGNGNAIVTANEGFTINSVKFTFTTSNNGCFKYGTKTIESNEVVTVTSNQATFVVANTGTATNGQVRITAIEVNYTEEGQNDVYYTSNPDEQTIEPSKTLSSIAVSGTPDKTTYIVGDTFDPSGLTVTGTYSDNSTEVFTEGITWSTPGTLTTGQTSVAITATVKGVTSAEYTVNGLTVNAIPEKTIAEFIASEGGKCYLTGTVSNIANTNYGNFDLTDESGTIYIYGCLNAAGEAQKFSTLGVVAGDKIKVLAEIYEVYNEKQEAKNVKFVEIVEKGTATQYTITISGIQNGTVTANANSAAEGDVVTLTATPAEGYIFSEWNVTAGTEAITVENNKFTMPAANVTVSATFTEKPKTEAAIYVKKDIKDILSTDVVIITMTNANGTYAISNDNGTSAAPTAVQVDVNEDKIESSDANILWNITYTDDNLAIYPNAITSSWLYCTNTNNGVRVGTNDKDLFVIDGTYLKHSGTSRYVGVYNNQDFRCYTSKGGNIENQTLAFYVKTSGNVTPDPEPTTNGTLTFKATNEDGYWATFSCDKDVIFDANDVIVYTVAVDDNQIVMIEANDNSLSCVTDKTKDEGWVAGYYVQAGAAVLINSVDESVNYYFIDNDPYTENDLNEVETDPEYNMLVPCTTNGIFKAEADGNKYYKLAYGDYTNKTKLGFWWGAEDGSGNFKVKAGGAVLCVPQATSVKGFSFDMAKDEDAIKGVEQKTFDTVIYDMQGRKVSKTQKGLYIINGRKMVK